MIAYKFEEQKSNALKHEGMNDRKVRVEEEK
jgi:hypothetical protein